jgi:indole-3-glycerol phosphate synthase
MTSILHAIADQKRIEVAAAKKNKPLAALTKPRSLLSRDFIAALKQNKGPAIIAEIKKASPSKGIIRQDFDVVEAAIAYEKNGACCLSVLTDIEFFQGHPDYLALAKSTCSLPVLRKDFIIDSYQVYESYHLGADCILLIAALLDDQQMLDFYLIAHELGMAVLVESHTKEELDRALLLPTPLVGINNRSLHTFKTDLQLSIELMQYIPEDKIVITESGINTKEDIKLMQSKGINTFLIGESLMRAKDIGEALRDLM